MSECRRGAPRNSVVIMAAAMLALWSLPATAEPWPLEQEGAEAAGAQETQAEESQPEESQAEQEAGPGDGSVLNEVTSDDEEEALRLVERILEEQQLLLSGQNFVYQSGGRRDPFRNLLQLRQRELEAPATRPAGLPGFLIGEIQVTAVASFQGRWQALLVGLDRRTYTAGVGTELYDGRIVEINANEVVFEQEVQDLIGARSTRQVVRKLNNGTEG